ncbi:TraB/GumN family protein [Roseisalinus antarcticus]|uniref:TraB family protein n=1 Tax=Roseisalinus antarcticus TaxID=254357 RepID=A0A1Y5RWZ6_9RHOB|nr:TraB/GumN family protein [Roseisalinus antarcticus]SLN24822.1 TraB family protein [Roseisalinus antarcticus]
MPRPTLALLLTGLLLAVLPATAARAQCTGDSFADLLTAAERAEIAAEVAAAPFAEGLFWQARKGEQALTLIGTMHAYDPRLPALMDRARPLLADADALLVEITPAEEQAMQDALAADPSRIVITDGPTLPELLPTAIWQDLAEAAAARQIPAFMAAKMRPWYLTLSLAMPPCVMPDVMAGRRGLDHMIMQEAEALGLPMRALEPWETVLSIFSQSTMDEQLEMLRLAVGPAELQAQSFVAMLDGYFAGRTAEIWAMSRIATYRAPGTTRAEADAMFQLSADALLTERNIAWMQEIAAAPERDILIAVGALHLPGETGLLRLLDQAGWDVTPLER